MTPKSPPPDLSDDNDADFVAICSLDYEIELDRRNRRKTHTASNEASMPANLADLDETESN